MLREQLTALFERIIDTVASRCEVVFDEWEQLAALRDGEDPPVLYFVSRYPNSVERALLRRIAERHGFRPPRSEEILSLRLRHTPERFYFLAKRHRRRTVERLGRLARAHENKTQRCVFVPIRFFTGRGPRPMAKRLRFVPDLPYFAVADIWTAFVFFFYRNETIVDIGPPIGCDEKSRGTILFNQFSRILYRKEKRTRGSPIHHEDTVAGIVLSGPEFEAVLENEAITRAESLEETFRRSRRIFDEIASTMWRPVISALRRVLLRLFRRLFSRIETTGLETLKSLLEKHPVVLIPRHQSHIDYLLVSYVLFHAGLAIPYIAAGSNLNIGPLGWILRNAGGFFIRRRSEGDRLYKAVLERYLIYLLKQGHGIEFFLEGGRTRTGFVLPPRLGILKYLIRAIDRGARGDAMFVPVGITYERVAEDRSLSGEFGGARKSRETLWQLWSARHHARMSLGSVSLVFGEPLSLKEQISPEQVPASSNRVEEIGNSLIRSLSSLSLMSLRSAIAASWCVAGSPEIEIAALDANLRLLLSLPPPGDSHSATPELKEFMSSPRDLEALASLLAGQWDLVPREEKLKVLLEESDFMRVAYYKNIALQQLLVPTAALACSMIPSGRRDRARGAIFDAFSGVCSLGSRAEWEEAVSGYRLPADHGELRKVSRLLLPLLGARLGCFRFALEFKGGKLQPTYFHRAAAAHLRVLPTLARAEAKSPVILDAMLRAMPGLRKSDGGELFEFDVGSVGIWKEEGDVLEEIVERVLGV